MKIEFPDHSYIEISKSIEPGKIIITVAAKHYQESSSLVINSVEITAEQFRQLVNISN